MDLSSIEHRVRIARLRRARERRRRERDARARDRAAARRRFLKMGAMGGNGERFLVKHGLSTDNDNKTSYLSILEPCHNKFERSETHKISFHARKRFALVTSCGGLLCSDNLCGKIVICNPATKKLKFLSSAPPLVVAPPPAEAAKCTMVYLASGFGFDAFAQDFKVVRIFNHNYYYTPEGDYWDRYLGTKTVVELYSVNTGDWIDIKCPEYVGGDINADICAYVLGTYHWLASYRAPFRLISFDFSLKSFSVSSLPDTSPHDISPSHQFELLELDHKLVAVGFDKPGKSVSLPYKLVFWVKDTSQWKIFKSIHLGFLAIPILLKHDLLFLQKTSDDDVREVFVYDFVGETLLPWNVFQGFIFDYPTSVKLLCYKPSKIKIPGEVSMDGHIEAIHD